MPQFLVYTMCFQTWSFLGICARFMKIANNVMNKNETKKDSEPTHWTFLIIRMNCTYNHGQNCFYSFDGNNEDVGC